MNESHRRPVALVTGGAVRVGRAIAAELAESGYDLLLHYAASERAAVEVRDSLRARGARVEIAQADLADRSAIERLASLARAFSGGELDLLVHNAANFERVRPDELDAGAWDRAMALNAAAPYLLTIALAAELRAARGAVVAIGCLSAERPFEHYIPYSVSKAALVATMRGLARALAPDVRVNVVSPGTVLPPDDYDASIRAKIAERIPLRRLGDPADVARAVVFFAKNDFITGQVLAVDGGRMLV